ncbi:MAG: UbiA family prenyltransferase, partial [Thermoplasmatales archaeon]|nr:UbiA family prenyltransferase [Thermoplasmatales archaeon]
MRGKIKDYIILIRPYWIVFFGLIPVIGAMCNGQFIFFQLSVLFIIGMFTYIFGSVQNDYFDKYIDKKSKYVSERPLALDTISEKEVIFIILFSLIISLSLAYIFLFTLL